MQKELLIILLGHLLFRSFVMPVSAEIPIYEPADCLNIYVQDSREVKYANYDIYEQMNIWGVPHLIGKTDKDGRLEWCDYISSSMGYPYKLVANLDGREVTSKIIFLTGRENDIIIKINNGNDVITAKKTDEADPEFDLINTYTQNQVSETETSQDRFPPIVQAFKVTPLSLVIGESISIDYSVSDNDGSGLKQVELWRKDVKSEWQEIKSSPAFGKATVSGKFTDTPSATGNYWYSLRVVDNDGNWNDERNSNSEGSTNGFEPNEVEVKEIAVLTLYVHDGSINGPTIPGTKITGQDGSDNSFDQTTDNRGYVMIKGTPGTWSFSASAKGYETNNWDQDITETDTKDAFLQKNNVILTLYVHSGAANGPMVGDAKVTGQDGSGNSFYQTTDSRGYVTIKGTPGAWSFSVSANGYETNNWDQEITETDTKDAFLNRYKPNQLSGAALPTETTPGYHDNKRWSVKGTGKMGRPTYQPKSSTGQYAPQSVVTSAPSSQQGYDISVVGKWLITGIEDLGPSNYYSEFYSDGTFSETCRYVELNELQDTIVNGNNALGCATGDWTQSGNSVHAKIQNSQTTYELTISGDSMNGFDIHGRSISGKRIHEGELFP